MDLNKLPSQESIDKCKCLLDKFKLIKPEQLFDMCDIDYSRLFAMVTHNCLRYNIELKSWMFYNGKVWIIDDSNTYAQRKMKEFATELTSYAHNYATNTNDNYFKYVDNFRSATTRNALLRDSTDINTVDNSDFDTDNYKINLLNGTFDLITMQLLPHDPDDLITKIANVNYIPGATSPLLDKFMMEIMDGDSDLINYVYEVFGYTLSGLTNQEQFWLLLGESTRNGKSTLLSTFAYMLGDSKGYVKNCNIHSLSKKRNRNTSGPSSDLARLNGSRFVIASEPPENFEFDDALIKQFTGNDAVAARMLFHNETEFIPTFKMFIASNHRPIITDESILISSRLKIIPFKRHFSEDEQNKLLKSLLKEDQVLSALLNKCLEGWERMSKNGFNEPDAVKNALSEYQTNGQVLQTFFDSVLTPGPQQYTYLAEFYPLYEDWCSKNGFVALSRNKVNTYMKNKGIHEPTMTFNGLTQRNVLVGYSLPDTNVITDQTLVSSATSSMNSLDALSFDLFNDSLSSNTISSDANTNQYQDSTEQIQSGSDIIDSYFKQHSVTIGHVVKNGIEKDLPGQTERPIQSSIYSPF